MTQKSLIRRKTKQPTDTIKETIFFFLPLSQNKEARTKTQTQ